LTLSPDFRSGGARGVIVDRQPDGLTADSTLAEATDQSDRKPSITATIQPAVLGGILPSHRGRFYASARPA
jgi:hypothetical protein